MKPVQVRITKTEYGPAVPIPEAMLASIGFKEGDTVNIYIRNGKIEVTDLPRPHYDVEELVAQITDENLPEFIDYGLPVGREIW